MKRNKAINVTKRDIRSAAVEDRNYCYNYVSGNARTYIKHTSLGYNYNSFKDLELQNVNNRSHLTCSCQDSIGKCQVNETGYFTTKLKQMQPKRVADVGVGNVKTCQRRKAKRVYLPQTEERSVGTTVKDYPKCHHFNRYDEFNQKVTRNCGERAADRNKKYLLDKKLSPLIRKKSNYTNPLNTSFRKQEMDSTANNSLSLHSRYNVTTQACAEEIPKSPRITIFKELAINTDLFENSKTQKSEVDLSDVLNTKNGNGSSLDSLVQHVYNLDKPCNATLSTATLDPMENKLEREYRKIFSNQSRDCACNNKISAANSDSLLRRFEALRRDLSLKDELNKNLSKTSIPVNEPGYKDVSIDSDPPSLQMTGTANRRMVTTISSEFSETRHKEKGKKEKKKISSSSKLQKSSYWRRSDVDSDHQGTRGRFKLWGKKVSLEDGSHKKSKIKCSDVNKKSEGSMKFGKLLKKKSSVKKEGKKFRFFKKKTKVATKISKSKTDVTTGRCEVREGRLRIGKGPLRQDCNTKTLKKMRVKYEDKLLNAWIKNFLTKSDAPKKNLRVKYSSGVNSYYSSSTDVGENSSSEMDMQLTTTATVTNNSSLRLNKSPFINFSNQYIQAWMLTKTILDRLVKPKIYWSVKTEKYNKKKTSEFRPKSFDCKEIKPKKNIPPNNNTNIKEIPKPKSLMVDICLGCTSGSIHQCFTKQSIEEVYNVIDYETPQQSSPNSLRQNFEKEKSCIEIISKSRMKDITNCRFIDTEDLKKIKRTYSADIFQENELDAPKTRNAVAVGTATEYDLRKLHYPVYGLGSSDSEDDLDDSVYLLPKTCKHSEIYLRKFYRNWRTPLDLDLWCISDTNLHPSYDTNTEANFKSYSNITNDIQYTTLVSSCDTFANNGKDKHKKSLLKNNNFDYLSTNIGIRISPKDSLEVFKKRKLYSDSNKGKWKHDNELSVSLSSSTKSKSHFRKLISLRPTKKRVTISNYEVDKDSKVRHKEKDLRKKKNLHCLSSSLLVSDTQQACRKLPPRLEKKPTLQNIAIRARVSCSSENSSAEVLPPEVKCLKSASKEHLTHTESCVTNCKKQLCSDNSTNNVPEKKTSEKINDTKSGFFSDYFKPSSLIKNKYQSIYRKFITDRKSSDGSDKKDKTDVKKCAITTDVQKVSTMPNSVDGKPSGAPNTDLEVNRNKGRITGLHFKKQPIRRNVSRACWTTGDKLECSNGNSTDNTTKASSKENTRQSHKAHHIQTPPVKVPTRETINVTDKDRHEKNKKAANVVEKTDISNTPKNEIPKTADTPKTTDIPKTADSPKATDVPKTVDIPKSTDISKTPQSGVLTLEPDRKKCSDDDFSKEDLCNEKSECDFIEIVFKIRCKHGDDRAMVVNITDSHDRIKKDNKMRICEKESDNSKHQEIYLVQNESGTSTVRKNSKNCTNVKILIKNCKNDDVNKRKDFKGNNNILLNSKTISTKYQNISSNSIKAINNYPYSVHKFTIDLTKSVKNVRSNNTSIENITILGSKNQGTATSNIDTQRKENSSEINDDHSNKKKKSYKSSKTSSGRKTKVRNNKVKNEELYYSSATLRPYRPYSFTRQMSNYKHLRNKVLQKIVDCAKDFNKGMRKEKQIKKISSTVPSLDYSDKNDLEQSANKFSKELRTSTLYSHFLNATSSYGYCHFDSMVRVQPKSNVNNYLFTLITREDKHKKLDATSNPKEHGKKKKKSKKIATRFRLTNHRTNQARQSVQNGDDSNKRSDFMHDLSTYDIGKCVLKQNYRDTTIIQTDQLANVTVDKTKLDNNKMNVSKLRINSLNKGVVCVSDERKITIVSSTFVKEKCISCHETGLEATRNHRRREKVDIFQLTEIKRAVFEMYNTTDISNKSELFLNLPKFESDVEKLLIM